RFRDARSEGREGAAGGVGGVNPNRDKYRRFGLAIFWFDHDEARNHRNRALELADFPDEARARHGIDRPIALSYSNGANIAAALMLLPPGTLAGAALLRAMVPLS